MKKTGSLRAIFAVPLLLAAASHIGLIVALTGDGWRDASSWARLAIPVLAVGWAMRARHSFRCGARAGAAPEKGEYP